MRGVAKSPTAERHGMNEPDLPENHPSRSSPGDGTPGWLDGVIAGFMTDELEDAVDATGHAGSNAEGGGSSRAWVAEGRARIDDTLVSLLTPVIRKAMEGNANEIVTRLERIESRLDAIERAMADR